MPVIYVWPQTPCDGGLASLPILTLTISIRQVLDSSSTFNGMLSELLGSFVRRRQPSRLCKIHVPDTYHEISHGFHKEHVDAIVAALARLSSLREVCMWVLIAGGGVFVSCGMICVRAMTLGRGIIVNCLSTILPLFSHFASKHTCRSSRRRVIFPHHSL